jgi:hypothetical protein
MRLPLSQTLAVLSLVSSTLAATYRQHKEVIGEDFIEDAFTVEGISDPTHGRVYVSRAASSRSIDLIRVCRTYVNKATAQRFNLTYATKDRFILRADSDSVVQRGEKGRRSVRMKSKDSYTRHVAV